MYKNEEDKFSMDMAISTAQCYWTKKQASSCADCSAAAQLVDPASVVNAARASYSACHARQSHDTAPPTVE